MLSRVADSIYWMHRYLERADNIARFIDVNQYLSLDMPMSDEQWMPLLATTASTAGFTESGRTMVREDVIDYLAFAPENPNSILRCVEAARENARVVRDQLSSEVWESINVFYFTVRAAAGRRDALADPMPLMARIRNAGHLIEGIVDGTNARTEGFHWGRVGRMLERADKTSRILDVKYFILLPTVGDVGTPLDDLQWAALLKSASALEMYRKRHGRIAPDRVASFLLLDREFPRSVQFCLARIDESMRAITGSAPGTFANPAEQLLGRLRSMLAYSEIGEIISAGLHEFLDLLQADLNRIDDAIYERFFALGPVGATAGSDQ